METKSLDCTSDFYQATYLRRADNTEITPGDPFELVEKEEVSPFKWPVVLLPPQRVNKRISFSFLQALKSYFRRLYNDAFLLVEPRIDIFARCNVNGSTFSSQFNRTDRGSNILSYCVDRDDQGVERISPYFAQITFFFSRQECTSLTLYCSSY